MAVSATTGTFNSSWSKINLSVAWATYLNPTIAKDNLPHNSFNGRNVVRICEVVDDNLPFIVESVLATMIVNGLSQYSYNSNVVGGLKGNPDNHPWTYSDSSIAWTASTTTMDGLPTSCSPLPYCTTPIGHTTFSHKPSLNYLSPPKDHLQPTRFYSHFQLVSRLYIAVLTYISGLSSL
jgi:hypothetical protein